LASALKGKHDNSVGFCDGSLHVLEVELVQILDLLVLAGLVPFLDSWLTLGCRWIGLLLPTMPVGKEGRLERFD
jgi:hypothetical protein